MKKLFSKILATLLILGVMTGCGATTVDSSENIVSSDSTSELPLSSEPTVTRKLELSLASKVTTDNGSIILQDNKVSESKNNLRLVSLEGGTPRDDLNISPVETAHTIIESSEISFDLAIVGLVDGPFSITIKENNELQNDLTSEFLWIFRYGDARQYFNPCSISYDSRDSICQPLSGEHSLLKEVKNETEIRIFRLFSKTYDFKASDLKITVNQSIDEAPSKTGLVQNGTVSSDLILNSFDFVMEYDNSLGYTDLNNIGFGITSELFEVKYTDNLDLDTFYDEGTVLPMSLTDVNVPYEAITIVYRRAGTEDDFVAINNFLVVFPHLGGIKTEENPNPRLSFGPKFANFFATHILFFNSDDSTVQAQPLMRAYNNIWTGINRIDAKILVSGYDDFPLEIPDVLKTPESLLFSYYRIVGGVEYMGHDFYDLRLEDMINLNLSIKLYISGVIFDLGTLYITELLFREVNQITEYSAFTMNPLQPVFK